MDSHSPLAAGRGRPRVDWRKRPWMAEANGKWQLSLCSISLPALSPTHAKRDSPKTRPGGRSVGTHLGSCPGRPFCWGWKRKRKGARGGWKASLEVSTPGPAHMRQSSIVPHSHLPPHGCLPPCLEALLNGGQLITSCCPTLGPFSFPDPPHSQSRAASALAPDLARTPVVDDGSFPRPHNTGSFLKRQT